MIDFDELMARLLEEELKINPPMAATMTVLMAKKNGRIQCWGCGEEVKPEAEKAGQAWEKKVAKFSM